jgi:SAM-dependent methyltransferase
VIDHIKNLLEKPTLFDLYQASIGANNAKRVFIEQWARPSPGDRVVDIGCGTGAVVPFLPDEVEVIGIDISSDYIIAANARYGSRASFHVCDAADPTIDLGDEFDIAYAFGVFHHLPDDAASRLLDGAMSRLRPGGRFVSIDPTLVPGQSWLSRLFVTNDRGQYIRTPEQLIQLFHHYHPKVEVRMNLLRIPFAQALMCVGKDELLAS